MTLRQFLDKYPTVTPENEAAMLVDFKLLMDVPPLEEYMLQRNPALYMWARANRSELIIKPKIKGDNKR